MARGKTQHCESVCSHKVFKTAQINYPKKEQSLSKGTNADVYFEWIEWTQLHGWNRFLNGVWAGDAESRTKTDRINDQIDKGTRIRASQNYKTIEKEKK